MNRWKCESYCLCGSRKGHFEKADDGPWMLAESVLTHMAALRAFVERVATYTDYTHDDVDEVKILHELQHAAAQLVGYGLAQESGR